jgi:hypothetical protein
VSVIAAEPLVADPPGQGGLLARLARSGRLRLYPDRELAAIGQASVEIVRAGAIGPLGCEILTGVSAVVVAAERVSRHEIDGAIAQLDAVTEVHRVGDCRHPRSALDAVYDGAVAGLRI